MSEENFKKTIDKLEGMVREVEYRAPRNKAPEKVPPGEVVTRHDLIGTSVPISEEKARGMVNLVLLKAARKAGVKGLSVFLFKFPEKMTEPQRAYIEKATKERLEKKKKKEEKNG